MVIFGFRQWTTDSYSVICEISFPPRSFMTTTPLHFICIFWKVWKSACKTFKPARITEANQLYSGPCLLFRIYCCVTVQHWNPLPLTSARPHRIYLRPPETSINVTVKSLHTALLKFKTVKLCVNVGGCYSEPNKWDYISTFWLRDEK